jgi:DNA-binding MarR family transcriptional regulator
MHVFWAHLMSASVRPTFELLDQLGLSLSQMKVLHALDTQEGELSIKELGSAVACSMPSASRTAEELRTRGYVERREDPDDRRMKRLRITDAGRDVVRQINNARLAGLEEYTSALTDEQRAGLMAALRTLPHHQS